MTESEQATLFNEKLWIPCYKYRADLFYQLKYLESGSVGSIIIREIQWKGETMFLQGVVNNLKLELRQDG